jgi:hypothetical protein
MLFSQHKPKRVAIALSLLLTIAILTFSIPTQISAHNPPINIQTLAFLNVAPNPIGVGQSVTLNFWLNQPPPTANGVYGDRWDNLTVTVTNPNGTKEKLGPFSSDATGGTFTLYTPNIVGNYTFQFFFTGQTLAGRNLIPGASPQVTQFIGDYYQPSNSTTVTLTVQQEPIQGFPQNPLPSSYWSRPINAENNNWYSIGGSWLGFGQSTFANTGMYNSSGNYNPYTSAPNSPHILWTKPIAFGGIMGGEYGFSEQANFYATSQYEPKFAPVIIAGVLYYTEYPSSNQNPTGITAVDLHTGQTLWRITDLNSTIPANLQQNATYGNVANSGVIPYTTSLRCGQILDYISPNQYGGLAYLWTQDAARVPTPPNAGISYSMWDAFTGKYILTIANGTSMTLTSDDQGSLIGYYVNTTSNTLVAWNSSQAILYPNGKAPQFENQFWRPVQNSTISFSRGIMWSRPLPTNISGNPVGLPTYPFGPFTVSVVNSGTVLVVTQNAQGTGFYNPGWQVEAAFDGKTGQQLWMTNRTQEAYTRLVMGTPTSGNGTYIEISQNSMTLRGYDLRTGSQLWTTSLAPFNPYDTDGVNYVVANGTFYIWGLGGDVWSVTMSNGKINWHFHTGAAGYESPYGIWPLWTFSVGTVADGKLYVPEGHMYSPPMFRGAQQLCLNTTTGEQIWGILGFDVTSAPAISDGIMTTLNAYDNQLYTYGKGPVVMSLNAPSIGVTTSTPVTFSGTIIDNSPGTTQTAQAANFPNGVPVVSDASMARFMEYVYMQQPMPTNTTGVPVSFSVLDANGNLRNIGSTISDANGGFSFTWTPDITGAYTVYASFAGSESYYATSVQAYLNAASPSSSASPGGTTGTSTSTTADLYFVPAMVGVIIILIIILALLAVLLRRR